MPAMCWAYNPLVGVGSLRYSSRVQTLVHSLAHLCVFDSVRFGGSLALKAGILPFRYGAGGLVFLVAAPKPVKSPSDTVPFAIARGSRRVRVSGGDWADARGLPELAAASQIESAHETALREGEEELGLPAGAVRALYDCGILAYKDYGIHFFLAEVAQGTALLPARDSAALRWVNREDAREMAEGGQFNPSYLPLLEALAAACEQRADYRL